MGEVLSFNDNYSPIGDLIVIATCVVILVLAYTSFVGKNRAFLIFNAMIGCLLVASFSASEMSAVMASLEVTCSAAPAI